MALTSRIGVYVSAKEKKVITESAKARGLKVGPFLRVIALEAAKAQKGGE